MDTQPVTLSVDPTSWKKLKKKDTEPSINYFANTKPDRLAKANLILMSITTKDKVAVACMNDFIFRDKFQYRKLKFSIQIIHI